MAEEQSNLSAGFQRLSEAVRDLTASLESSGRAMAGFFEVLDADIKRQENSLSVPQRKVYDGLRSAGAYPYDALIETRRACRKLRLG